MVELNIDNLDQEIVHKLKRRAELHGCSVESELDTILKSVLGQNANKNSLKDLLLSMPDVWGNADFCRTLDNVREIAL